MKHIKKEPLLLGAILLAALSIRLWGVNYDLPYIYHPDEPIYINISQNIFKTGDLNPRFFNYPSLFFYINALAYIPYYLFGKLIGVFETPNNILGPISIAMGVVEAQMPTAVLLGRMVTISFGVATVGLTYAIGKQITGKMAVGGLASFMVALAPISVYHSRLITPDTFVTFFALAAFGASVLIYQQGKTWQYVLAGICVGFTASSKYNGGLIILPLILAHFLHHGKVSFKKPQLYLALLLTGVGFIATTPYAILDSATFIKDLRFEAEHYATGHTGMEGDSLKWYLNYMWNTAGGIYLSAILGMVYGIIFRPKEAGLLSIFPVVYFVFISSFIVRNDRTFLPMTPFLFLSAAWFLVILFDQLKSWQPKLLRQLFLLIFTSLVLVMMAFPMSKTFTGTQRLMTVNSRETGRVWINDNVPPDAKIAVESYAPFVNPTRFSVQGFVQMIDYDAEWYIEQGFDYLVFSQGMYWRFYNEPERYGNQIAQYEKLFEQFDVVMVFTDGNYEVKVYKVNR